MKTIMQPDVSESLPLPAHQDPQLMSGTMVFIGTRVPVQTLFEYLLDGYNIADFLDQFPSVTYDQVQQMLRVAQANLPIAGMVQ